MSKTDFIKCSIFLEIAFLIIFIPYCTSAPIDVTENAYTQFIAELNRKKCSVPSQVQLPFVTIKANNFEYLSPYLGICQKTESTKRDKEAIVLCKEIFGNIRNISCSEKTALPDISVALSKKVCTDIVALKDAVPENDKSLLKRLTDGFLCDIMCDSEFEKACQVLLWSFEVQKLIASVENAEEPEQPNVPEDGGEMNDNFKQENAVDENNHPQTTVNSENEKKKAEEPENVNYGVGHNGIAELPEPHNLEVNPEQKPDAEAIPSRNGKPAANNKEVAVENQLVPGAGGLTGGIESTSILITSSTLSHQTSLASNLNPEAKTMKEITKGNSNDQNANKPVQSNVANEPMAQQDEINVGHSQGSNTATDEQTRDAITLAGKDVQDKKNANILADNHLPDNSITPANQLSPLNTNNNEIPGEMPPKEDQASNFLNDNQLPHESGNEESPNDGDNAHEQNPPNLVDNLAQNKPQKTVGESDKKTDTPTTNSQTIKETTQLQNTQVTLDKTSIAKDETKTDKPQTKSGLTKVESLDHTKADQPQIGSAGDETKADQQTNSGSIKVESQDQTKADAISGGLISAGDDQKKPKVAEQAGELDNTIPDTTGVPSIVHEKPSEESQKSTAGDKSVIPNSVTETSTKTTVALEKMEGGSDLQPPVGEEADEDLENTEDEYSRPDYDGGLYEVPKNKESNPDAPNPITVAKEILTRPIDYPSENVYRPNSNDIQMIAAFPEQEDSHFFFYFLSIVLILMAGYLLFHNKQKIIALIVEGRHERNRRSHRVGYKKLETK